MGRAGHDRPLKGGSAAVLQDLGATATHHARRLVPSVDALAARRLAHSSQTAVVAIVREVLRVAGAYQGDGGSAIPGGRAARAAQTTARSPSLQRLLQEEGIPYYFKHDGRGG